MLVVLKSGIRCPHSTRTRRVAVGKQGSHSCQTKRVSWYTITNVRRDKGPLRVRLFHCAPAEFNLVAHSLVAASNSFMYTPHRVSLPAFQAFSMSDFSTLPLPASSKLNTTLPSRGVTAIVRVGKSSSSDEDGSKRRSAPVSPPFDRTEEVGWKDSDVETR